MPISFTGSVWPKSLSKKAVNDAENRIPNPLINGPSLYLNYPAVNNMPHSTVRPGVTVSVTVR